MSDPNFPKVATIGGTLSVENVLRDAYYIDKDYMHKWLGPSTPQDSINLHSLDLHILCAKMRKGPSGVMWITEQVHVTIDNGLVTCPECLEWIHA